jgi:hypothetical protein
MRDVGHEVAPDAFEALESGDVVKDQQDATTVRNGKGRGVSLENRRVSRSHGKLVFTGSPELRTPEMSARKRGSRTRLTVGVFSSTG